MNFSKSTAKLEVRHFKLAAGGCPRYTTSRQDRYPALTERRHRTSRLWSYGKYKVNDKLTVYRQSGFRRF